MGIYQSIKIILEMGLITEKVLIFNHAHKHNSSFDVLCENQAKRIKCSMTSDYFRKKIFADGLL